MRNRIFFLPDFISYDNLIVDSTTTTGQAECTDPALIESLLIPSSAAVEQAEARAPAWPPWARSFTNLNSAVTVSVWEIIFTLFGRLELEAGAGVV